MAQLFRFRLWPLGAAEARMQAAAQRLRAAAWRQGARRELHLHALSAAPVHCYAGTGTCSRLIAASAAGRRFGASARGRMRCYPSRHMGR